MSYPELDVRATQYGIGTQPIEIDPEVTSLEQHAMMLALDEAEQALADGNPPIGAALIEQNQGMVWVGKTTDKTDRHLMNHAEMRVYDFAQSVIGDSLESSTLASTAQPCTSCTPYYAAGKIGKIIYGAKREMVLPIANIMRDRKINLPELIEDGNTDTVVIENFFALESLRLFAQYGKLNGHEVDENAPDFLKDIFARA